MQYSPSVLSVFASEHARQQAKQLKRDILRRANGRPVVFHALSNNGIYHAALLLEEMSQPSADNERLRRAIAAMILDSAPSELTLEILTRGFTGFLAVRYCFTPSLREHFTLQGRFLKRADVYEHPLISPAVRAVFAVTLRIMPSISRNISVGISTVFECSTQFS